MLMQIRGLKTKDIFPMARILKKIGLKNLAEEAVSGIDTTGKEAQMKLGVKLITSVFENLYLAQEETNAWLADLAGVDAAEFAELDIGVIMDIFQQLKEQPSFANFLKQAGRL